MRATRLSGAYEVGQSHMALRGRKDKGSGTAVGAIYAAGGGGTETSWQGGTATNPNEAGQAIESACDRPNWQPGYRVVTFAPEWTWGNDTAITRISDLWTYAQANHGFSASKVHLFGVSMGGPCVLNWAKANPTKVASIALCLPAVDIQDIEDNGRATTISVPAPSTAFGNARPDNAHTPARNAASFSGMPMKIWYSTNDTVCVPSTVTTFAAGCGATLQSLGDQLPAIAPVGHGLSSGFDVASVAAFFDAHP